MDNLLKKLKKKYSNQKSDYKGKELANRLNKTKSMVKKDSYHWNTSKVEYRVKQLRNRLDIGRRKGEFNKWRYNERAMAYLKYIRYLECEKDYTVKEACKRILNIEQKEPQHQTKIESANQQEDNSQEEGSEFSRLVKDKFKNIFRSDQTKNNTKDQQKSEQISNKPSTASDSFIVEFNKPRNTQQFGKQEDAQQGINIQQIRDRFNLKLDEKMIVTAFTHPSAKNETPLPVDNENFAWMGNILLRAILVNHLFHNGKNKREINASLQDWGKNKLGRIGRSMGIHNHIIVDKGQMPEQDSIVAQTIKAIIGTIGTFQSLQKAQDWVEEHLLKEGKYESIRH